MKLRDIIPFLATAVLLAMAFPSASLWPLAYIALVPLLLWLRGKGYRDAFVGGMAAGAVFYGITFAWFASLTYWVGGIVLAGVALLVILFAAFWGVIAVGTRFFERSLSGSIVFAFPSMWVLMEYVHNHIFTGFGWGSVGYTQWNNLAVAQLASVGSVYAVSFYIVLINVLVYEIIARIRTSKLAATAGGAIIILAVAVPLWGKMRMQEPDLSSSLRIGVIQPNFSLDVKWSAEYSEHMLRTQERMTERVAAEGAELVVWPESAIYYALVDEIERVGDIARTNDVYLLIGSEHYDENARSPDEMRYYNSAFLINPEGRILGRYDKRHLAPFGEYVPLGQVLGFIGKVVPRISDFSPGARNTVFEIEGRKFTVLICFENSFPHLVRGSARLGSDFLVQVTNDGWFGQTAQPKQDLAIAVFRAIENGATLVRGTNTGISCFIDPWGRISSIVRASWGATVFVRGIAVETISTVAHDTFYKAYGDVWVAGCGVLAAVALGMCAYRRSNVRGSAADSGTTEERSSHDSNAGPRTKKRSRKQ
ncbi:MAG: apolipoprotein N-acyltransferase [Candidatus Abyssobacteria bacterium SURF_17]|uniref:Apolipoprotein N-acyltransferase n=1 Tax=Candidatus Abyssobacteria bacterium SURF_17 TaxID=2093361 RepID=A0A419EQG2_9BACT|nr:MAG: apolipoprotein N-acyltransferase [Candidatus Abyssubacteria bacterium SURF_17]